MRSCDRGDDEARATRWKMKFMLPTRRWQNNHFTDGIRWWCSTTELIDFISDYDHSFALPCFVAFLALWKWSAQTNRCRFFWHREQQGIIGHLIHFIIVMSLLSYGEVWTNIYILWLGLLWKRNSQWMNEFIQYLCIKKWLAIAMKIQNCFYDTGYFLISEW